MRSTRVALVGYAMEKYGGDARSSGEELGYRVVRRARNLAGLDRKDISSVHNATMDLFDGVTISNGVLAPAAGGYGRDCTRIQNGGGFAVISACASVLSGASDVAVVSSVDSAATDLMTVSCFSSSPHFGQPLGMNSLTSYALFSSALLARQRVPEERVARVAANSFAAGARNPFAHIRTGFSVQEVLDSELIASPLRARTVTTRSSFGAAALVLASEDVARRLPGAPLWVRGFGMSTFADDLDACLSMDALRRAASAAFEMAGVDDPAQQLTAVEMNSPFAPFELAAYAPLGLCSPGDEEDVLAGNGRGGVAVNPSGGTLCTNAPNSGGVVRMVQAATFLASLPPSGRYRAAVHDSDLSLGVEGSSHAVIVLQREAGV